MSIRIKLFATPQVQQDHKILQIPRRKNRALLYYLAAQDAPVDREQLARVFWPDSSRASALQGLRSALYELNKYLGANLITDENRASLSPDTEVDVREFEARLSSPTSEIQVIEEALRLYTGDFLQDFDLPDVPDFENWLIFTREYYWRLATHGFLYLSQLYEENEAYFQAIQAVERALSFDVLQEDLQRELIRLLYLSGDRPAAIRQYDRLRRMLDEEMGVPPMLETRELYDRIVQGKPIARERLHGSQSPDSLVPFSRAATLPEQGANVSRLQSITQGPEGESFWLPFFGRQDELQHLWELTTTHKLILIEGEPGIGKTRLGEEFMRSFEANHADQDLAAGSGLAIKGTARELERNLPYFPIVDALRSLVNHPDWEKLKPQVRSSLPDVWLSETARLLPGLWSERPPLPATSLKGDEHRLWEGVTQLIVALSRLRPVLLFIDDLQWCDASSLGLLGYLIRHSKEAHIRFLAAARPVTASSPGSLLLQTLMRENLLERLPLDRLTDADITSAAQMLSPDYAYPLSDWLNRNSEGNPYILVNLIQHARQHDILVPTKEIPGHYVVNLSALSGSPVIPHSVYELIQDRLKSLSSAASRVVNAAITLGRDFEFDLVGRAAGLSESAALDALDELQQAGLISQLGGKRFTFTHNLIMEVAYRETSEARYRLMHRRVAEAMVKTYSPRRQVAEAGIIAFHYFEGEEPEKAAAFAFQAGEQSARLAAWSEAIHFFEQALLGIPDQDTFKVWTALGDARLNSGKVDQASEAYRKAIQKAQEHNLGDLAYQAKLNLASSLLPQAKYQEAISLAQEVLAEAQDLTAIKAEFIWGTALSLEGMNLQKAAAHLEAAREHYFHDQEQGKKPPATDLARIQFELGSISAQLGDLEEAVESYRMALQTACEDGSEESLAWCILAQNNLAYHLHLMGDPKAEAIAQEGYRMAQEKGMFGQMPYLLSTLGEIALAKNDLVLAEDYFSRGLDLARQIGMEERVAGITANLGLLDIQRGEIDLAVKKLADALSLAESLGTGHLAAQIRIWLAPLVTEEKAHSLLKEARNFAGSCQRKLLLKQIQELEGKLENTGQLEDPN